MPNPFGPGTLNWTWYTIDFMGIPIWQESGPFHKKGIRMHEFELSEVKIYPNPGKDIINIQSDLLKGKNVQISLYDLNMKEKGLLYSGYNQNSNLKINVGNFQSGIYLLIFNCDGIIFHKNLLINK